MLASIARATVKQAVTFEGTALHSGVYCSLSVEPAPPGSGVGFIVKDSKSCTRHILAPTLVRESALCTELDCGGDGKIRTVEHLLATFLGCGITDATVTVQGPEIPILDGSALQFLDGLQDQIALFSSNEDGRTNSPPLKINSVNSVLVLDLFPQKNRKYELKPHSSSSSARGAAQEALNRSHSSQCKDRFRPRLELEVEVDDFQGRLPGPKVVSYTHYYDAAQKGVSNEFRNMIAPARTFCFEQDVAPMQAMGLEGGSLANSVVFKGDGDITTLNNEGLRLENEWVRHKV
eukprot:CAMPEP_0171510194 /NCGR_PEP_ID=MMETSP0959-20130129/225_1 /TAXON_ID=87120 /ORGANISM="Aurantiochytrium limacinum, Strain ATCCMYA-1381" /LENGTH=290 /DNA_ID=CAMNT_0012047525 /DNA_START=205 /DNA_END=1074 /DNA_ORIENTATION=-